MEKLLFSASSACPVAPEDGTGVSQAKPRYAGQAGGEYKFTNLHSKAGTFKAVDNQGMAVSGKYTLIEPENVRFEIFRQRSPSDIVNGTVSLKGDVLTFTSADGKEIERYKREKQ